MYWNVLFDSSSEKAFHRGTRQLNAPFPIDCKLSSWSAWGPCDPCTYQRFRSRRIERFGQFGGTPCLKTLGDTQSCTTSQVCPEEPEPDCGTDFQCNSGRCIKRRLVCNIDNDCGDLSDEDNCEPYPQSPCRNHDIDVSEVGRTAGQGINVLGMKPLASPFDNNFFNGLCERVRDGNTRTYYRKPWNVGVLNYDLCYVDFSVTACFVFSYNLFIIFSKTKADKTFASVFYHDRVKLLREVYIQNQKHFNAGLSLKYTLTEKSNKTGLQGNVKFQYNKNSSLGSILKRSTERVSGEAVTCELKPGAAWEHQEKWHSHLLSSPCIQNQTFLHVKGKVQLGRFQMRSRDVRLTDSFLDDLNLLPVEYDKGEYFKFLEDYGTHYAVSGTVGGKYELVYVLDNYAMSRTGVTVEDVKRCLGYDLDAGIAYKRLQANVNIDGGTCSKINAKYNSEFKDDAVIDDVISLVEGGKIDFSVKIKEMLLRGSKIVDVDDYTEWAKSLVDAPVVIEQRVSTTSSKLWLSQFESFCSKMVYGVLIPVVTDGGWSCWSAWSTCINGESTRSRQCNNPTPEPGGRPCQGESIEKRPCEAK
ncbi:hypothetical protein QYF61_001373 [Mycteria americana]|uniref:Complement component C9 n=1 Tax=Mycteria americana TaxID=33587 RepID=A0AAN7MX62_MYCAM|nr:hypothetical protein QYF61_001373 [Mycteria americana]